MRVCVRAQAESVIERAALVEQIGGLESDLLAETQAKEEAQVSIQGLEGLVANLINKQVGGAHLHPRPGWAQLWMYEWRIDRQGLMCVWVLWADGLCGGRGGGCPIAARALACAR